MNDAIRSMMLRAKVAAAYLSGRTLIQTAVLEEDTHQLIELLLPPGYVARPAAGADMVEVQIGGLASHKVLLGGDNTADALSDLQTGECGLSNAGTGQQLVLRVTGIELVTALLKWGPTRTAMKRLVQEEFLALYNAHTHPDPQGGNSGPPNTPMTAAHLTGGS